MGVFGGDGIDVMGGLGIPTLGSITGAEQQAAGIAKGAALSVEEQQRQFDQLVELMAPFVGVGEEALQAQKRLIGLGAPGEQEAAIEALRQSPQFQALTGAGEEAILARGSATGGLRGGDIQGALAQFRPQMLSDLISQQYGRLGGLTQIGQASAAGQAGAGMDFGRSVGETKGQAAIAAGGVPRQTFADLLQIGGAAASAYGGASTGSAGVL